MYKVWRRPTLSLISGKSNLVRGVLRSLCEARFQERNLILGQFSLEGTAVSEEETFDGRRSVEVL